MVDADRQFVEALFGNYSLEVLDKKRRVSQLADAKLGSNLHSRCGANDDGVVLVGDGFTGAEAQRFVARKPP